MFYPLGNNFSHWYCQVFSWARLARRRVRWSNFGVSRPLLVIWLVCLMLSRKLDSISPIPTHRISQLGWTMASVHRPSLPSKRDMRGDLDTKRWSYHAQHSLPAYFSLFLKGCVDHSHQWKVEIAVGTITQQDLGQLPRRFSLILHPVDLQILNLPIQNIYHC